MSALTRQRAKRKINWQLMLISLPTIFLKASKPSPEKNPMGRQEKLSLLLVCCTL